MGLSILSNIPSLEAQNQLAITNKNLQNTLFQLSSGSKINSGADDPAGLSIADGLQANISALAQSAQNVTDGVGLLQTADGALSQVTTLLNRAVTLATEAGNAGLTPDQQAALQNEFHSITNEINQIGANTTYNNTQVFTTQPLAVFLSDGSNLDQGNLGGGNSAAISVSMNALSASALGLASYATGTLDLTTQPTAGNTVQIGAQVYTFVAAGQANAAGQVSLGTNVQTTLQNLQNAVNGTVTASPGTYGVGTLANQAAQITMVNGGSAVVQALQAGTGGNAVQLIANLTSNVGGANGTLSGGVNPTYNTGTLSLATAQPGLITTAAGTVTMTALPGTITNATGTLNLTSQPTAGNAVGSLTLQNAVPVAGDTATVGNTTYRFETVMTTANDVKIGGTIAATLNNLMYAVNGTGGVAGTNYFAGTATAGTAMISNVNAGTGAATVVATTPGTAGDSVPLSASFATPANVTVGAMAGGAASDTVTIGAQTYTFVVAGAAMNANQVALGGTLAGTITNLKNAVNGTGSGTYATYGSGTTAAGTATINYSGAGGAATLVASTAGVGNGTTTGNSVAFTSTISGAANPSGHLDGGAAADTLTIGGQTYTFVAAGQATAANEVALGSGGNMAANINQTLTNLQGAVNGIGTGTPTTYGLGTTAAGATIATITQILNGVATVTAGTAGAGDGTTTGNSVALSATSTAGTTTVSGAGDLAGGANADTVTIGNVTYTFVAAGQATAGNEVALGSGGANLAANIQTTLNNLKSAVNAASTGVGTNNAYSVTTLNTGASVTTVSSGVATAQALTAGAGTTVPLSASGTISGDVAGVNAGNLSGGANAVAAGGNFVLNANPSHGNTVTLGNMTYTFVTGAPTAANDVVINNTSVNGTLTNLMNAVTGGAGSGTTYGAGTATNTFVNMTVSGNQAVVTALTAGAGTQVAGTGNYIALSANLSNGVGGGVVGTSTTLANGGVSVDLSNSTDAQAALTSIASAVATVASQRGAIGSGINQMNAALNVMNNTSQNLASSMSGIRDADIGKVVANMSKYQILTQTGIAALAQSNTSKQAILRLLP